MTVGRTFYHGPVPCDKNGRPIYQGSHVNFFLLGLGLGWMCGRVTMIHNNVNNSGKSEIEIDSSVIRKPEECEVVPRMAAPDRRRFTKSSRRRKFFLINAKINI